MPVAAGYSTPMLHVADVARSIAFYRLLGFQPIDIEGERNCPFWARMHCEGGALMFLAAEEPPDPRAQSILICMYTEDLPGLRDHLLANGLEPSPIRYPDYMKSGELRIDDPDGYAVLVNQWGEAEHEAWEADRKARLQAAGLP